MASSGDIEGHLLDLEMRAPIPDIPGSYYQDASLYNTRKIYFGPDDYDY